MFGLSCEQRKENKEAGWWNEKEMQESINRKNSSKEVYKEETKTKKSSTGSLCIRKREAAKAKEKASRMSFKWLDTKEMIKRCIQPLNWLTCELSRWKEWIEEQ